MNIPEHERIEHLKRLGLPNNLFIDLFGEQQPVKLRGYLGEPSCFYSQGWPDRPGYFPELVDKHLLPLWECATCVFAVDISNDKTEYIRFYVDCPSEYEVIGNSIYAALLAVIEIEFDGGALEEELMSLIQLLKMPEPENLYRMLMSGDELDVYKKGFCIE